MSNVAKEQLPEYTNPPVNEVVCGVQFEPLRNLLAPHLGIYWEGLKPDYGRCEEHPPMAPTIEQFGEPQPVRMEFSDSPPLPRTWFIHSNETLLVQVQRDRFLYNWRRAQDSDDYPRFPSIIKTFKDRLREFESFLEEHSLGKLSLSQLELTYINHIEMAAGADSLSTIGKALPDFNWRGAAGRFLGIPEGFSWRTSFALPDQAGRLHTTIHSGTRRTDSAPVVVLNLTARGLPRSDDRSEMWAWFDLAHEWIVRGFTDLTGGEFHQRWGRVT